MSVVDADLQKLFDHVEANRDAFVARVMDYVRHPSVSAHNIGIGEVAAMLVDMLKALGMEAETVPTRKQPMVLGRRNVSPDKPTVLLYGHYDVQPPDPLELWESPTSNRPSATAASMRGALATTRVSTSRNCWRSNRILRSMANCPAT